MPPDRFVQSRPHLPQFDGSVWRLTQLPLHSARPALQVPVQVPFVQVWPASQVPQVSMPPQPSAMPPQVAPCAAQVVGVQVVPLVLPVQVWVVGLQVMPVGQSLPVTHWTHVWVVGSQVMPAGQSLGAVQLERLGGLLPPAVLQVWVSALQAIPAGQLAVALQPQLPLRQRWPLWLVVQSVQTPPVVPQAEAVVPGAQVAPAQQPPLQGWPGLQTVVQVGKGKAA